MADPDDIQSIIDLLGERGVAFDRPCPECGDQAWQANEEISFLPTIELGDPGVPGNVRTDLGRGLLLVSCLNCAYTKSYDVGLLGYTHAGALQDGGRVG